MRISTPALVLGAQAACTCALQMPFHAPDSDAEWNLARPPLAHAPEPLIFDTVRSFLQHWPNTRYRNGHAIVPGIVPAGTLLYHGTSTNALPSVPDWTATDPEHSLIFCRAMHTPLHGGARPGSEDGDRDGGGEMETGPQSCWHLTLAATRALKVLYFDGSSAAKMSGGPMDSQDIVAWGRVREDRVFDERKRITALCKWAEGMGLDGFVRMEMDFEIMLCDFTAGVEVVSFLQLASPSTRDPIPRKPGEGPNIPSSPHPPSPPPPPPQEEEEPRTPRGAEPLNPGTRVLEAGSWHNTYPGDTRVQLDYTRTITLYDARLAPDLLRARAAANAPRLQHRVGGASAADLARVRAVLEREVGDFVRAVDAGTWGALGAGGVGRVDWRTLMSTVAERYSGRIEVLAHILNTTTPTGANATAAAAGRAQRHIRGMLAAYALHAAVPESGSGSGSARAGDDERPWAWAEGVYAQCATAHTALLARRERELARGERVLLGAVQGVAREVCRVLVGMWAEGVAAGLGAGVRVERGTAGAEARVRLVARWRARVAGLMAWLDWSADWLKCRPACGFEEMCVLPTWPYFRPVRGPRGDVLWRRAHEHDDVESRNGPDTGWEDPQPSCMRVVEAAEWDEEPFY